MKSIEQLSYQEVKSLKRREFVKGVVATAAVVGFRYDLSNNTEPALNKVDAEVTEELKQNGVQPPTEQQKQASIHNEDTSLGLFTNSPLPAEERERFRKEGKAASDYIRDYKDKHSKLMWAKAPLLKIRGLVDMGGAIAGGATIIKKVVFPGER